MFEVEKRYEFIESPKEDVDFSEYEDTFDKSLLHHHILMLKGIDDDTQSWVKYKDIKDWNEKFLQKTLKIYGVREAGGYLLVNISDV